MDAPKPSAFIAAMGATTAPRVEMKPVAPTV